MFGILSGYKRYEKDVLNALEMRFMINSDAIEEMMNSGVFRRTSDYIREGYKTGFNKYECGAYLLLLIYMNAIEKGLECFSAKWIRTVSTDEESFLYLILLNCKIMIDEKLMNREEITHFVGVVNKSRVASGLSHIPDPDYYWMT